MDYSGRESLCTSMIKRYRPGSRQSEKLCKEWMDTAYNVCIDYVLPGQDSSLWGRIKKFFSSAYATAMQTSNTNFYVQPHEMDKQYCDYFMRKMYENFVLQRRIRDRHENYREFTIANFDGTLFAIILIFTILLIVFYKMCKRTAKEFSPLPSKKVSAFRKSRKLQYNDLSFIPRMQTPISTQTTMIEETENLVEDGFIMEVENEDIFSNETKSCRDSSIESSKDNTLKFLEEDEEILSNERKSRRDSWIGSSRDNTLKFLGENVEIEQVSGIKKPSLPWDEPKSKVDCNAYQSLRDLTEAGSSSSRMVSQFQDSKKRQTPNIIKRNVENAKFGRPIQKRILTSFESISLTK